MRNSFSRAVLICAVYVCAMTKTLPAQVPGTGKAGHQLTRFSTLGDAIDAHDGEIAFFNGIYYLYGTSYDCGFQWGNKTAPFCGFKTYSSPDMVNWTDQGFLFDARTPVWQTRCDGKTYGCFRPHVIYNARTTKYVLWINVYDNVVGYRVFTSGSPTGPFTEEHEPRLAVNDTMPSAGLNNGDHDTFVDDDGTAWLAYTDWRKQGSIVIEKLSEDYLTGTGVYVDSVTSAETEAPGMFKRNGLYYVVFSDPNCGYCAGTGKSYKTAPSPLGPWSPAIKISDNSCGGQPSFVSTLKVTGDTIFLYGSDLWNNAAKNEALANYYWAPLKFRIDGSIEQLSCPSVPDSGISLVADTSRPLKRIESFIATKSGTLHTLSFIAFRQGNPDAGLMVRLFATVKDGTPDGSALFAAEIPVAAIGWSGRKMEVRPMIRLKKNKRYFAVLTSLNSSMGNFGFGEEKGAIKLDID